MSTAGFHITEDCAEVYLQNESGMEFLQLARRLHDYLQQGQHLPVRSLFEATDGCKEISREAFDTPARSADCLSWTLTRRRFLRSTSWTVGRSTQCKT